MNRSAAEVRLLTLVRPADPAGTGLGPLRVPDWEDLLRLAVVHGVGPLVFRRVREMRQRGLSVPPAVFEGFRRETLRASAWNLRVFREMKDAVEALREGGVEAIALKGAHLAPVIYGNLALRPMSDLDLLVRPRDLPKVEGLLARRGFTQEGQAAFREETHLAPFHRADAPQVEIHFSLGDPPIKIPIEDLFARAKEERLEGVGVLTLCPEDLLIHLCIHSALHHGFDNGVRGLVDISLAVERFKGRLDWRQVWERGKEWGGDRSLVLALVLAHEMMGTPMPAPVPWEPGFPPGGEEALGLAREMVFARGGAAASDLSPNLARLAGKSGFSRLAFLARAALPGKRWSLARFGALLRVRGRTVFRILAGEEEVLAAAQVEGRRNRLKDWVKRG